MRKSLLILLFGLLILASGSAQKKVHFKWIEDYHLVDARKEIKLPNIPGFKTLKCDFHMHTIFSDGIVLPSERVNEAWREGLDVIAITDHSTPMPKYMVADYNTSWKMAVNTAKKRGIMLVKAIEYTKSEPVGHLNIFFVNDANVYSQNTLLPDEALDQAKKEGAFVVYNHPGWPDKNSDLDEFHLRNIKKGNIQGVEVINGNEFYPLAIDYCDSMGMAPFSNTDIHSPIQANYNINKTHRNLTLVFARSSSEESLKEAMFARRTLAVAGDIIAGSSELIAPLMKSSIEVKNFISSEFDFSCDLVNHSDITYTLYGPEHRRIVLPANRTIQLNEVLGESEIVYEVINAWVDSKNHLKLPLHFLFTSDDEVMMPFTDQNLTFIDPSQPIMLKCLTHEAKIYYTTDGSEPDIDGQIYISPIKVENSALLKARAYKEGMKPGRVFKRQILLNSTHKALKMKASKNGLSYKYFEGDFLSVSELGSKGRKVSEGIVEAPSLTLAQKEDHFGFIFNGFILAPSTGEFEFFLESDDGALLKIDGIEVANNDGSHSRKSVSGRIALEKGLHAIEISYFDDYEDHELFLFWKTPNEDKTLIEPGCFFVQ